jgi:hypothetical protein
MENGYTKKWTGLDAGYVGRKLLRPLISYDEF